jgi:hypothetical protein
MRHTGRVLNGAAYNELACVANKLTRLLNRAILHGLYTAAKRFIDNMLNTVGADTPASGRYQTWVEERMQFLNRIWLALRDARYYRQKIHLSLRIYSSLYLHEMQEYHYC